MPSSLLILCVVALAHSCSASGALYGMSLVGNQPAVVSLSKMDYTTGNVTVFPTKFSQLDGMSDLNAADENVGIYYYLGDTSAGTTLVGIDMKSGEQACSGPIPLRELGYVGVAQSLNYDLKNKHLVLTGLLDNKQNASHGVLRTKGCDRGGVATVVHIGTFGDANFVPMLHSSALDSQGQRLYVEVAVSKTSSAIGVINLNANPASKDFFTVIDEDSSQHSFVGMQWDRTEGNLVGVVGSSAGLFLRTLKFDQGKATWNTRAIPPQEYIWLYGNAGDVSALDTAGRFLYVLAGKVPSGGGDPPMHLVQINLKTGSVSNTPPVSGLPFGTNSLLEMLFVP